MKLSHAVLLLALWLCVLTMVTDVEGAQMRKKKKRKKKTKTRIKAKKITKMKDSAYLIKKLQKGYKSQNPPSEEHATYVQLGIYVNDFFAISERNMDYSLSIYMRQAWWDPRLDYRRLDPNRNRLVLDPAAVNHLWVPDTFVRNEKRAQYHTITVPNQMVRVNSTGHVWWVKKISATLSCPMFLKKYPMDTQQCPMMFESFGYTMDVMYFGWLDSPIDVSQDVELPQFTLENTVTRDCSQNYTGGAFPCLEIKFVLRRALGFFLIQVYMPCILIVTISWVGFWINAAAVPARVTLGLVTVLTMTTQLTGANASMPKVSYIKAIDVWMSTCLVFVFAGLIEYAIVNVLSRMPPQPPKQSSTRAKATSVIVRMCPAIVKDKSANPSEVITVVGHESERRVDAPITGEQRAARVEEFARKAFPTVFILFIIVYWIYYVYFATEK